MSDEDEKVNKWVRIRRAAKTVASQSTVHAIPNVANNEQLFFKLMWAICFLISSGFCISYIQRTVVEYLDYEVVTSVTLNFKSPTDFPQILICGINPLVTNYSVQLSTQVFNDRVNSQDYKLKGSFYDNSDFIKFTDLSIIQFLAAENKTQLNLSMPFDQMLLKCIYAGRSCNVSDFEWQYTTLYGNCYMFNSNSTRQVTQSGPAFGLHLELYVEESNEPLSLSVSSGAHVFIFNSSHPVDLMYSGFDVASGAQTNIALNRVYSSRLPEPFSNCDDADNIKKSYGSVLTNLFRDYNMTYSQEYCLTQCYKYKLSVKCGCYDINDYLKSLGFVKCNLTQVDCMSNLTYVIDDSDVFESCAKMCPLECETQQFAYTISSSSFPAPAYAKVMLEDVPILGATFNATDPDVYDKMKKKLVSLNVYYESLLYTYIIEQPSMTSTDLVGKYTPFKSLFLIQSNIC